MQNKEESSQNFDVICKMKCYASIPNLNSMAEKLFGAEVLTFAIKLDHSYLHINP